MIWKAIAGVFYIEAAICVLLTLPVLSALRWKRLLHSQLVTTIWSYLRFYFHLFALVLVGLFVGAVIEMKKQQSKRMQQMTPEEANIVLQKLFRAQRNFFVSMFAAILLFVLHRIGSLILSQATLEAENNEHLQQIKESAAMVTRSALETDPKENEMIRLELYSAKDELSKLKEELRDTEKSKEMMKADLERSINELEKLSQSYVEIKTRHEL